MLVLLSFILLASSVDAKDYAGYKILRLSSVGPIDVNILLPFDENEVQMLSDDVGSPTMDVLVAPSSLARVEEVCSQSGLRVEVLNEDVGESVAREKSSGLLGASQGDFSYTQYHSLKDFHAHLDKLARDMPDKAQVFSIGTSYEGRDMKVIKISNNVATSDSKPMIWIDGGIHAREWVSSHTVMYIVDSLLQQHEQGLSKEVESMLNTYQFNILVHCNPDGYEFSRTGDRMWRKTRRPSGCKYNQKRWDGSCRYGECKGIDPNRNWDSDFANRGVSGNPCSDVYPGTKPFSENNTHAMKTFLSNNFSKLKIFLTCHSYSQLFLTPLGWTLTKPKEAALHKRVGDKVVAAIKGTHGSVYTNMQSAGLYPASGDSADWVYEAGGVTHSYTFELRDTGKHGFLLPQEQIKPTGEEIIRGFIALVKAVEEN